MTGPQRGPAPNRPMEIGVGLPSILPTVTGPDILAWARESEQAGFASLGVVDRVVYDNHEPLLTLAAAAAVTSRIRLATAILIAPVRGNGALLAKQLATVDSLSGGRLTVGLAVGGRADDYAATEVGFDTRGALFDAQLSELRAVWRRQPPGTAEIGPTPVRPGGPPLLVGGNGRAAVRRVVTHGAGWIAGAAGASMFATGAGRVRQAWSAAGRDGSPRFAALAYYAVGADADSVARAYLRHYYASDGHFAETVADTALTSADTVRHAIVAFTDAGCDELILLPCSTEIDQLHGLADLILS